MLLLLVGGGFVGTVTAVVFAETGHHVWLLETDPVRARSLAEGRPPFEEPGVQEALSRQLQAGRLHVAASTDALPRQRFDAAFLCVGTPPAADGSADLSQVEGAAKAVAAHTGLLCVKSTVPPGTLDTLVAPLVPSDLPTASVPEFLAEGTALRDARAPQRIVIGTRDDGAAELLEDLHAPLGGTIIRTTPRSAEMAKYASNAMLAARVGMVNELANLCEKVGASVDEVMEVVGRDPRIGPLFLQAGLGFGGSCFPKDVMALCDVARRVGSPAPILEETLRQNDLQPLRFADRMEDTLEPGIEGKRIAVLGLAFKPDTSDARGSRAIVLARELVRRGAKVRVHDPFATAPSDLDQAQDIAHAVRGAEAVVIATPWDVYLRQDWGNLLSQMHSPTFFDPWRRVDATRIPGPLHTLGEPQHESRDTSRRARDEVPALHEERA